VTRALVLHHDANSDAGIVGRALDRRGIARTEHFICAEPASPVPSGPMPSLDGFDLVVALGSRWSVDDREPIDAWIDDELELLAEADRRGLGVLGVCFGGQALAAAHGGRVSRTDAPEVGWYEVDSREPAIASGPWFQWHFDRFDVPPGASLLASTPSAPQAFRLRRNLGVQFHPELDRELLELWMLTDVADIEASGLDPTRLLDDTDRLAPAAEPNTVRLVDWFLDEVAAAERAKASR
jgi:GMP synthase-like glutamine amidotransferase